jgi:hypothetical protein
MSDEGKTNGPEATEPIGGGRAAGQPELESRGIGRRDLIKALASIPIFGVFFYGFFKKKAEDDFKKQEILAELGVSEGAPAVIPDAISRPPGDLIRLGIIGYGIEGSSLVRHAGFAHPEWVEEAREAAEENPRNQRLKSYLDQTDLNIAFTGVCDLFDVRAERAIAASAVDTPSGGGPQRSPAKRYLRYTDMLESGEVDAIVIATPDHWHSRINA